MIFLVVFHNEKNICPSVGHLCFLNGIVEMAYENMKKSWD